MSSWKSWQLTGSEESYREFCDECRQDEILYRKSMMEDMIECNEYEGDYEEE